VPHIPSYYFKVEAASDPENTTQNTKQPRSQDDTASCSSAKQAPATACCRPTSHVSQVLTTRYLKMFTWF
jgi:hypothetical protein